MNDTAVLEKILIEHCSRYPCMQIQDMIKLIYQNEFAGGHLISDRKGSLARLKEEYLSAAARTGRSKADSAGPAVADEDGKDTGAKSKDNAAGGLLFESTGNGLYRIHLAELGRYPVSLETVNSFFIYTANSHKGDVRSFESKLGVLRDCCEKGLLPFDIGELDGYIRSYRAQGYPAVSHSAVYREAYHPAYRIVKGDFCRYFEVFCRIDELLKGLEQGIHQKNHVTVAIDGNCCAGKSSLAAMLAEIYDCNVFHMDDFFLTPELRTEDRLNETGGNVDYVRFRDEVIHGLESGCEFEYRVYSCAKKAMERTVRVTPKKLNIVEGSYSMHPTLADHYDLRVFLTVEAEEQSRRILRRNGPAMHSRFMEEWVPMENRYFREFGIASKCDIVI